MASSSASLWRSLARHPRLALNLLAGPARQQVSSGAVRNFRTSTANRGGAEGWGYRKPYEYSAKDRAFLERWSTGVMAVMWWWIFWHLMTEPEHLFGEGLPDPREWTDKELGVPPDEE